MTRLVPIPRSVRPATLSLALVAAACGGGSDDKSTPPQDHLSSVDIVPRVEKSTVFILSDLGILGQSSGTGIVLDGSGNILTNNHVVEGAAAIQVRVPGGTRLTDASIVGRSPCDDLAVIRANRHADEFQPATLGSSSALKIGSTVYAVGYPIDPVNRDFDATSIALNGPGTVNRLDASFWLFGLRDLIQTDTPINHGNSGGPLLNEKAEVVGVNTLGFSSMQLENVAYAIAIDEAKQIWPELLAGKDLDWVGINIVPNDPRFGEYGIPFVEGSAVIVSISEGPFKDAQWYEGDIIVTVANKPIQTMGDLCPVLRTQRSGDKITASGWGQDRPGSRSYIQWETDIVLR